MIGKIHISGSRHVLALCDENLIGKKYKEDENVLDLSSEFYKGKPITEEQAKEIIEKIYMVNAAGEKSVNFLLRTGHVDSNNISKVDGIPHAQVVFMQE